MMAKQLIQNRVLKKMLYITANQMVDEYGVAAPIRSEASLCQSLRKYNL